jgi:hypothetical protein
MRRCDLLPRSGGAHARASTSEIAVDSSSREPWGEFYTGNFCAMIQRKEGKGVRANPTLDAKLDRSKRGHRQRARARELGATARCFELTRRGEAERARPARGSAVACRRGAARAPAARAPRAHLRALLSVEESQSRPS